LTAAFCQVNTHRLTESDFQCDVIISRWRPWRHFTSVCQCCSGGEFYITADSLHVTEPTASKHWKHKLLSWRLFEGGFKVVCRTSEGRLQIVCRSLKGGLNSEGRLYIYRRPSNHMKVALRW